MEMHWRDRRLLVIVAHPDDEALGCGGAIAKLADLGASITVLLAFKRKDPRGVRHWDALVAAFQNSCDVLGARAVMVEPLATECHCEGEVYSLHDTLLPWVEDADTVFTHWPGDAHQAHRGVARAVEIATRPFRLHREVVLFDIPTSTDQAFFQTFSPNAWVVIDRKHCEAAVRAMESYEVEHEAGRRPSELRRRLEARGAEIGVSYAEAFAVVRRFE